MRIQIDISKKDTGGTIVKADVYGNKPESLEEGLIYLLAMTTLLAKCIHCSHSTENLTKIGEIQKILTSIVGPQTVVKMT